MKHSTVLIITWALLVNYGENSGVSGEYTSLADCKAEVAKEVTQTKAAKAKTLAEAAAYEAAHAGKHVGFTQGLDLSWECKPSDGSASAFGSSK